MTPNLEAKQIIIESLAFENVNYQCKRIIRPLKTRSAPLEEWIQDTINIESHDNDDAWTGEVISRGLRKKIKMSSVSIVANKVTLKETVNRVFLETMFSLSIIQTEHPSVLYMQRV